MKHDDFIKTLKSFKKHYIKHHTKSLNSFLPNDTTEHKHCICKDSLGESKYLYTSKTELDYVLSTKAIKLTSYPCPYEKGWHITKN